MVDRLKKKLLWLGMLGLVAVCVVLSMNTTEPVWAGDGQSPSRQTVPTLTPIPRPTNTPVPAPPTKEPPEPPTPTPTSAVPVTVVPTATSVAAVQTTAGSRNSSPSNAPSVLPTSGQERGFGAWSLIGSFALALISGSWLWVRWCHFDIRLSRKKG